MLFKSFKMRGMLFYFVLFSTGLIAQNKYLSPESTVPRDSLIKVAHTIIDSARCRVLISVDEQAKPHAREMDPLPVEDDMVIWLGTHPLTKKVKQIRANPNVVFYYYDTKAYGYVSIEGTAELVNDSAEKAKHWKEYWAQYYPDREKDFILIKITPVRFEIVSYKHQIFWITESFKPHSVELGPGS
jgi:general stress protein 26